MGTTLTALQAGSIRIAWTVLIEGYKYILTDGDTAAAVTAHTGSDHVGALGGLHVMLNQEQRLDPWKPIGSGGSCKLLVRPTSSADTFGVDVSKRDSGDETILTATIDRDATTVPVKSTAGWATSGDAHCGTECFAYANVTGTSFTTVTRGKYDPFYANGGMDHRVGYVASSPKLEPLVTEYPRRWVGRWASVWMHRVVGGVLDAVGEAQLVFAGRIDSIEDSVDGTVVQLRHVLDVIRETTVGRELWNGKIVSGVYLTAGETFGITEDPGGSVTNTANTLTVVASGAATDNEMNAGFYSIDMLQAAINTWFRSELTAARIDGAYSLAAKAIDDGVHSFINWEMPGTAGYSTVEWYFGMPKSVRDFLGFTQAQASSNNYYVMIVSGTEDENHSEVAKDPFVLRPISQGRSRLSDERGVFVDNFDYLPASYKPVTSGGEEWGVFLINEELLVVAQKVGDQLRSIRRPGTTGAFSIVSSALALENYGVAANEHNISHVSVRQIVMLEMSYALAWKRFLYSTGTAGYNHSTLDVLGYGLGIGIPRTLMGFDFISSADHLPGAYLPVVITIDKPTRFVDLFEGEMILRCAFLRWINGRLDLCQWRTPLTGHASAALAESNKASPGDTKDDHRMPARESSDLQRPIVRFLYNRDITKPLSEDGFKSTFVLEDRVAIDDAGGEGRSISIKCRNTYSDFADTGAGIESLAPGFLAIWPLFSRPMIVLERSIDSRFFEGLAIGDCVTVSDSFARDPDTGRRIVSLRPAIIMRHWYTPGGNEGGDKPTPAAGGVHLMLLDSNRVKPYGPAAQVDDTENGIGWSAGYNSSTETLRCYANKYSEATEDADASWFAANYLVTIIEIDPADPTAPQSWDRTVASVSGNDITLSGGALGSWDPTKKYRIVFDDYTSVTEAQKAFAYQADDTDGLILDAGPPHQYAVGWPALEYTENSAANDPIELPPNAASGDGLSRDVAHDLALVRLLNNLEDYKLGIQSPYLSEVGSHGVGVGVGEYELVQVRPIFLTEAGLSNTIRRELSVSPMIKSSDGSSITCRVSLCAIPPTGASIYSVNRGTVYSEVTFSTSSTSYVVPTADELDIGSVKPSDGVCWLLIELTEAGQCRGLVRCTEGARIVA